MAHDDELCMCERCVERIIRAHDAHLDAWIEQQRLNSSSGDKT